MADDFTVLDHNQGHSELLAAAQCIDDELLGMA